MLLVPRRTWPVLLPAGLAGFIIHDLQFGFHLWTIIVLNIADTLEILTVCLGLEYCFDGVPRLSSWRALAKYSLFAVFLGPFLSAFVIAFTVPGSYEVNWRIWFFSQALIFLTLTPAILSWAHADYRARLLRSKVEAFALIAGLAILGYLVFVAPWNTIPSALVYSFVPFFLWAALRFGSMGVSNCMIVISLLSISGAVRGQGPFLGTEQRVLSLQLFLILAAIPFTILAAAAEERERNQEALSNVSRKLIDAHEEERCWIARELHDDINQRIAAVVIDLESLKEELPVSDARARQRVEAASREVADLGSDLHGLSHRLHSASLEYLGLEAAAAQFCEEVSDRHDVDVEFKCERVPKDLPSELALCVFRVLQEALQNAIKHSRVRKFEVSLKSVSNELELGVFDSGVGFDPEQISHGRGLGLTSMRERLRLVNGRLLIQSGSQAGTRIYAIAPLVLPEDKT